MQLNSLYKEGLLVANKGFHKLLPAKIICIGDCSVGKTSIICRFIKDSFKHLNQSTLGFSLKKNRNFNFLRFFCDFYDIFHNICNEIS